MNIPKKLDVINRDDHAERFLRAAGIEDTFEIRNKINEIIDYLEDPENIIKAYKDLLDRQHEGEASKGDNSLFNDQKLNECANILANDDMDKIKEASKGECPHCDEKHMDGYAHNPKTCFMCRDNPPEHKCDHKTNYFMNAVNGCKVCSKKAQKALSRDGDPKYEEASECKHSWDTSTGECQLCRKPDPTQQISESKANPPEHEEELVKLEKDYIDSFGDLFHTWSSYGWWIKYIRDNFVAKEKIKREIEHLYFSGICFMQTNPSGREIFSEQVDKSKKSLGLGD